MPHSSSTTQILCSVQSYFVTVRKCCPRINSLLFNKHTLSVKPRTAAPSESLLLKSLKLYESVGQAKIMLKIKFLLRQAVYYSVCSAMSAAQHACRPDLANTESQDFMSFQRKAAVQHPTRLLLGPCKLQVDIKANPMHPEAESS